MKGMDMKSRIELELKGKDKTTIKELNLDSCRSQQIDGLNDDFKSLETLSLINAGLTSLKGFAKLPNLKKLELSDNRISSTLDNLIGCENISHLNLSGNKIKDLDQLAPLSKMEHLRNLDLFNCEVTQMDGYREKVFKLLPNLKFLDGFDQNEQEDDHDNEEGDSDDDSDDDEDSDDNEDERELRQGEHDDDDDDEDDDDNEEENDDDDDDDEDDEDDEEDEEDDDDDEEEEFVAIKKKKLDHNGQ